VPGHDGECLGMIVFILTFIITIIVTLLFTIFLHELGHLLMARKLGYVSVKIQFDNRGLYVLLPSAMGLKDQVRVLSSGVVFGFFGVLLSVWVYPLAGLVVGVCYLVGINHDLVSIRELRQQIKSKF